MPRTKARTPSPEIVQRPHVATAGASSNVASMARRFQIVHKKNIENMAGQGKAGLRSGTPRIIYANPRYKSSRNLAGTGTNTSRFVTYDNNGGSQKDKEIRSLKRGALALRIKVA